MDRLLKDTVSQFNSAGAGEFIPKLTPRLAVPNWTLRNICITWMNMIISISKVDVLPHLRSHMQGLFALFADLKIDGRGPNLDVRNSAQQLSDNLLDYVMNQHNAARQIKATEEICDLVVDACWLSASDARKNGLKWVSVFLRMQDVRCARVILRRPRLLGKLLKGVFDGLAGHDEKIASAALEVHGAFLSVVRQVADESGDGQLDRAELVSSIVPVEVPLACMAGRLWQPDEDGQKLSFDVSATAAAPATSLLSVGSQSDLLRTACLQWVNVLLERFPDEMNSHLDMLFAPVFDTLRNDKSEVVMAALKVLAQISARGELFTTVSQRLLILFHEDRAMMEKKGRLVIRQLCGHLDVRQLYTRVARCLDSFSSDLGFCDDLVQTLNWILLTSRETAAFREELRTVHALEPLPDVFPMPDQFSASGASLVSAESKQNVIKTNSPIPSTRGSSGLFWQILARWAHNPISALSLCLFVEHYELAYAMVGRLAECTPSVEILCQLDLLVQLIESPIFSRLRVQLLEPARHPLLVKALLGLAMLLPQTDVFKSLSERVKLVQSALLVHASAPGLDSGVRSNKPQPQMLGPKLEVVLAHFDSVANRHRDHRDN